eukprot:2381316-Lingulodinium_polyedra.AAC.1
MGLAPRTWRASGSRRISRPSVSLGTRLPSRARRERLLPRRSPNQGLRHRPLARASAATPAS